METELYGKIFARMDELSAIRYKETFGAEVKLKICEAPILSDCMAALYARLQLFDKYEQVQNCERLLDSFPYNYDYSKPYLYQQLDELGEKLLSLLS